MVAVARVLRYQPLMPRRGDDFGPTPQIAFPRLTPAVKVLLISILALFVVQLVEQQWMQKYLFAKYVALYPRLVWHDFQLWRLVTWPLVQAVDLSALLWAGAGLYFFGTDLEESFGTKRFLLFLLTTIGLSGVIATAYGAMHPVFNTEPVYGVAPLGFAVATAWGVRFPHKRLLFPPVSARVFVFIIIGIAVLSILARVSRESPAASLGSIFVGWLLGRYWDRIDDWLDRRRVRKLRAKRDKIFQGISGGGNVVDIRKHKPADKRYLN